MNIQAADVSDTASPGLQLRKAVASRSVYGAACALLAAVAFLFNWGTGHRGVFLLDQSMIFDGGWRILQGQTPYKDFFAPFGPVTFWIQAAFFRIFGVNWSAMVAAACVLSSVATLSTIRTCRLLTGGSRIVALAAGLWMAVCLQAPFGTLWLEQTAMFFDVLALQAVVESLYAPRGRRVMWQLAAGLLLAAAVLSKQNYGLFFVPVALAVAAAPDLADWRRVWRSPAAIVLGLASGIAVFVVWLWVFSDPHSFIQRSLVLATEIGRSRLKPKTLVEVVWLDIFPNRYQVDLLGVVFGALALLAASSRRRMADWQELAPPAATAILLPWFRTLTQASTLNDGTNNMPFVGLSCCLGIGLLFRTARSMTISDSDGGPAAPLFPARALRVIASGAALWGVIVMGYVGMIAWKRIVQQYPAHATFRERMKIRGMERLYWGDPASPAAVRKSDLEDTAAYLAAKGRRPFFVMGDAALLYGLLGVRSPQPMLYFLPSHSYRTAEIPELDKTVLESLERSGIETIVREKVTYDAAVRDSYPRFARTWAWFTANFEHSSDFGVYEIWERRSR
jgi:hypothetical protein